MSRIPEPDWTVSELEQKKMWAVTYIYEEHGQPGRFVDTWHITAKDMGEALHIANEWCAENVDVLGDWDFYEITNINLIRRGA